MTDTEGAPNAAQLRSLVLAPETLDRETSLVLGRRVRARTKACWHNAAKAHRYAPRGSVYVEGFALMRIGTGVLPIEHGYLLTPDGRVIDPTLAANHSLEDGAGYTLGEVYALPPHSARRSGAPGYGMHFTPRMVAAQEAAYLVAFGGEDGDEVGLARVRGLLLHGPTLYAREAWRDPWADIEAVQATHREEA